MDKIPGQKRAVQYLYPAIDPFDQRMLDVRSNAEEKESRQKTAIDDQKGPKKPRKEWEDENLMGRLGIKSKPGWREADKFGEGARGALEKTRNREGEKPKQDSESNSIRHELKELRTWKL